MTTLSPTCASLRVLGSGSTGNASLLRLAGRLIMIDAGLGPRTVAKRLGPEGPTLLQNLDALLLTHLDRDHFNPAWFATLLRRRITVYCHQKHLYGLYRHAPTTRQQVDARVLHREGLLEPFSDQPFPLAALRHRDAALHVTPLPLAHDRSGVFAFDLRASDSAGATRLGFATDLGHVPPHLTAAFRDVDILAMESNYAPPMQYASPRPPALKNRIMGGRGHLSNEQALAAVRTIVEASHQPPAHIVLLHLSRQCNCRELLRGLYAPHPHLADRLHLSHHQQPTPWLDATARLAPPPPPRPIPHLQMPLF